MKVGIVTLNGNNNFGNKLQNYATQTIFESLGCDVETIPWYYDRCKFIRVGKDFIKGIIDKRYRNFLIFDKKIKYSNYKLFSHKDISSKMEKDYDFFSVGSDQVWNPNIGLNYYFYLLSFASSNKRISFSASIGSDNVSDNYKELYSQCISKFKAISVREDKGKEIIYDLTSRDDIEVLVDPTMLLSVKQWDLISKKPKKLNNKKFILNYFLGDLTDNIKNSIDNFAEENNCYVINILDKNDPFYNCGPSEFLYLEKNAYLICTDSFHSSVFAILYDRPFIVFERNQNGLVSINSRIDTLIEKFKLKNRRYNGKEITKDNLNHDYTEAYKILQKERKKSEEFLKKALDIND